MITIHFPKSSKTYPTSSNYDHSIKVDYNSDKGQLFIDTKFEGYSYYLEDGIVNASNEVDLINTNIIFNELDENAPGHELASHSEEDPDLLVKSANICFAELKSGYIKVTVEGNVSVLSDGSDSEEFPFRLESELKIAPGQWQMEYAFGYEICPAEETQTLEDLTTLASKRLNEMADDNDTKATELIALFDQRDERSLRCYGKKDRLIIEVFLPIDQSFSGFVLAKNNRGDSLVSFKPDSVNSELKVMQDEFFTAVEAEAIIKKFISERSVDSQKYILRKKSYLF